MPQISHDHGKRNTYFKYRLKKLGIQDFDPYTMLWYGNYLKHIKRALQEAYGNCNVLKIVQMKFKTSLSWGQYGDIEVILAKKMSSNHAHVLCKWIVKGNLINLSLWEVVFEIANLDTKNILLSKKDKMFVMQLSVAPNPISSSITSDVYGKGHYRSEFVLYGDMVRHDGFLSDDCILDMFEQTRTELFGGQRLLREILDEANLSLVVHSMTNFYKQSIREEKEKGKVTASIFSLNKVISHTIFLKNIGDVAWEFLQNIVVAADARSFGNDSVKNSTRIVASARIVMSCVNTKERKLSKLSAMIRRGIASNINLEDF